MGVVAVVDMASMDMASMDMAVVVVMFSSVLLTGGSCPVLLLPQWDLSPLCRHKGRFHSSPA